MPPQRQKWPITNPDTGETSWIEFAGKPTQEQANQILRLQTAQKAGREKEAYIGSRGQWWEGTKAGVDALVQAASDPKTLTNLSLGVAAAAFPEVSIPVGLYLAHQALQQTIPQAIETYKRPTYENMTKTAGDLASLGLVGAGMRGVAAGPGDVTGINRLAARTIRPTTPNYPQLSPYAPSEIGIGTPTTQGGGESYAPPQPYGPSGATTPPAVVPNVPTVKPPSPYELGQAPNLPTPGGAVPYGANPYDIGAGNQPMVVPPKPAPFSTRPLGFTHKTVPPLQLKGGQAQLGPGVVRTGPGEIQPPPPMVTPAKPVVAPTGGLGGLMTGRGPAVSSPNVTPVTPFFTSESAPMPITPQVLPPGAELPPTTNVTPTPQVPIGSTPISRMLETPPTPTPAEVTPTPTTTPTTTTTEPDPWMADPSKSTNNLMNAWRNAEGATKAKLGEALRRRGVDVSKNVYTTTGKQTPTQTPTQTTPTTPTQTTPTPKTTPKTTPAPKTGNVDLTQHGPKAQAEFDSWSPQERSDYLDEAGINKMPGLKSDLKWNDLVTPSQQKLLNLMGKQKVGGIPGPTSELQNPQNPQAHQDYQTLLGLADQHGTNLGHLTIRDIADMGMQAGLPREQVTQDLMDRVHPDLMAREGKINTAIDNVYQAA